MASVKVVTLGHLESLHLQEVNRHDDSMDFVFVMEVLIKLAVAAPIFVRAALETDLLLQEVDAGPFGEGQGFHFLFPTQDSPALPC